MTVRRKALVTGVTGFVGWHVTRRLLIDGWAVEAVVRSSSRTGQLEALRAGVKVHVHDGTAETMGRIVRAAGPDAVFHIAANTEGKGDPADVMPVLEANVVFGTQLLAAMATEGVQRIVCTGTHWQHFNNETYNPVSLYAACKEAFEKILRYYVEDRNIRAISLTLFDTYGRQDRRPKLFNLLAEAASTGVPLRMSPGEQILDLVNVDDVAEAYCVAAAMLESGNSPGYRSYAIRSGAPIPLRELVALYSEALGKPVPVLWGGRPYRTREVMVPWSGGETLPGWRPRIGLREGIKTLVS